MYILVSVLPLIITLFPYYNPLQKTISRRTRKRNKLIFMTQLIVLILGAISNVIFPILSISAVPPIANILFLVYSMGFGYLIESHNLISLTPAIAADQIISKVIDMIVLTDTAGNIVEINESFKITLDYTDEDLLGKKVYSIFSNTELFSPEVNLDNSGINIMGFSIISKHNSCIPVKLSISKICDEVNTPLGNVYVLQDMRIISQLREQICEKEILAESLTMKNEQLKDLDRLKSDFLCNISHELRTPLSLMLSSLKLSLYNFEKKNGLVESHFIYRHLDIMTQNCYRLTKITNNIIDITKIDAGYFELNLSNYNIVNIVEEVTLSAAEYIKRKGITFLFDTDMEEIVIGCDAEIIERVVLTLISNAVKFTNVGGEIFVQVSLKDNMVLISVKDNGIGISTDKQQVIFDRFIQVDKSLSRLCEGSGIGLALAKLLVGLHQGTISVSSELTIGSTFTLALPVYIVEDKNSCSISQLEYSNSLNEKVRIEFSDVYI
jgi:PAS domain S-box-containing protein